MPNSGYQCPFRTNGLGHHSGHRGDREAIGPHSGPYGRAAFP